MSFEFKPIFPRCGSQHIVKNGRIHNKQPKYKGLDCGRQFIENPTKKYIEPTILNYIDKMLLEKIPSYGIARVTGVSKKWLQNYVNALYTRGARTLSSAMRDTIGTTQLKQRAVFFSIQHHSDRSRHTHI